ncbi:energy transducer TonB [bacterium]|nr:energy transducer TonB [bacterium]
MIENLPVEAHKKRTPLAARRPVAGGRGAAAQSGGISAAETKPPGGAVGSGSTLILPSGPGGGAVRQAEAAVSGQGLLAILTSGSRQAQDQTVSDVVASGGQASQAFDQVFDNIDRLAESGRSTRTSGVPAGTAGVAGARGGRTTTSGVKSHDLIFGPGDGARGGSGTGAGSGSVVARKSDIETVGLAPLTAESDLQGGGGSVAGARNVNEVSAVVYSHSQAIQYCYERELKRNPELKGKVVVRFTILPNGTVTNATILSSTLDNENVERCILSRVSRWDDFGTIDERLGNAVFRQVYTFGF